VDTVLRTLKRRDALGLSTAPLKLCILFITPLTHSTPRLH
jgi:hypothetical protein